LKEIFLFKAGLGRQSRYFFISSDKKVSKKAPLPLQAFSGFNFATLGLG
jgi:hypothetical protein